MKSTFISFLLMGGYWPFVWSAYGVFIVVFWGNILLASIQKKRILKHLKTHFKSAEEPAAIKAAKVIYESSS